MNGKDMSKYIFESQEWDTRRAAQLERIYNDEKRKLGDNENLNSYSNNCNSSPFIHVSNKPAIYAENQIVLSDSQFKEFMNLIERNLK